MITPDFSCQVIRHDVYVSGYRARTMWGGGPAILRMAHSQFVELLPLNEVPALTLESIDGKKVALSAFQGGAVLVSL